MRWRATTQPEMFIPLAQSATGSLTFVVSTADNLPPALRRMIWQVDRDQAIYHPTLNDLISETLVGRRFNLLLISAGGPGAGVRRHPRLIDFSTSLRTQEVGLRLAMGGAAAGQW